jgi:hypothetical protein
MLVCFHLVEPYSFVLVRIRQIFKNRCDSFTGGTPFGPEIDDYGLAGVDLVVVSFRVEEAALKDILFSGTPLPIQWPGRA